MLQSFSSGEFRHETVHHRIFSPSKRSSSFSSRPSHFFGAAGFLGFNLHNHGSVRLQFYHLRRTLLPATPVSSFREDSHVQKRFPRKPRVSVGFKPLCRSKTAPLPAKSPGTNGKKQKYGGVLPSILRSLESETDVERTLASVCEVLNPKEQTVILKEQSNWERVVRVFNFFKSQKGYVPNVIHYNIVLRALGRAGRWDDLRLCWIEMAQNGVLPTNNTYSMLVDVYGKAGLVKESLLWIRHMRHRGYFPDEVTMNTVVKVLKDAHEYDIADRFFKNWCAGKVNLEDLEMDFTDDSKCRSGSAPVSLKHFLSMELFKIGVRNPIKTNIKMSLDSSTQKPRLTSTYNTLIDLYGKAGRLADAASMFAEMLRSGVAMDTVTFNTMIHICGSHGNLPEAESLLAKMEEKGISPDTKTYNIFLSSYADADNTDAALKCYRKIREIGLFPDTVTHRAILHMLCKRKMVHQAESIISEMERYNLRIDEHSVPVIMKMYVDEGLLEKAEALFEKFQMDCVPSSKTLAAVMDVYAEKGLWVEAEAVFSRNMNVAGRKKDVLEYNVMIKAYGSAKLWDKAYSLFKGMKNQGTWPDECTYNSLIQLFSACGLLDQAQDLLVEMRGAGFKPSCQTFSSIIASYVHLRQLSEAVDTFREMNSAGVRPNEVVYGSLIDGFAETGRVEEALKYHRMMEESGFPANQIILTSLIKAYSKIGCLEGARQLYEKIKESEGGADIVASNSMLNLYAELGMVAEAKLIFDGMRKKGMSDEISFATMMYLYKSMGMLDEAIDVAAEMKQSGLLRDASSYNKVMACYAASGQLRTCGELLHDMISGKLLPDTGTFKTLFTVLKKGGLPPEAVEQLETSYDDGRPYSRQAIISTVFSAVGLHDLALESCDPLEKAETPLDCFAYNAIIYAYGSCGRIVKSLNAYMKMQDNCIEPDIVTRIYLVGVYGKAAMVEGVKRFHSQLKSGDLDPNESLFKAVISAYADSNRLDLAEQVRKEMRLAIESKQCLDNKSGDASPC